MSAPTNTGMGNPVIRHLIPCKGVSVNIQIQPTPYHLTDVFYALQLPAGVKKARIAGIWVLVQVTDGEGTYDLSLDLAWDLGAKVRRLKTFRVYLPDRLAVRNVAVQLPTFPCPAAGVYEFWVRPTSWDDPAQFREADILKRTPFRVEETS